MKRNMRRMFALVLSLLLVISLTGCFDNGAPEPPATDPEPTKPYMPENALELWTKVDDAMKYVTSVESTGELKAVYYYMGYEYKREATNVEIVADDVHYSATDMKMQCDELSVDMTGNQISAYYDGKMYIANVDDTVSQKLCAPVTKEDYLDAYGSGFTDEVDVSDCKAAEFSKNEDGTWELNFSGYTKKTVDKALSFMDMADDMMGATIEDMEITIVADEQFYIQTVTITFVFEEEEGSATPEFVITYAFSKYNTTSFDPTLLTVEEYTEVDDLHILNKLTDGIKERQDATSGHFVFDTKTTVTYYSQKSVSKETDIVTYGKKNGAYYYAAKASADGVEMGLTYQNGTSTMTYGGEEYSTPSSDADAKALIDSWISASKYDSLMVTDIEKQSDGIYMLTCGKIDTTVYEIALAESITLNSGEQTIKVFFEDGKLIKIDSIVHLVGKMDYNDITIDLNTVVDFEKEADYPTI